MAGITSVLTGHPLDTVKVRMQMLGTGFFETVSSLIKSEGSASLYKGIASPLYTAPFTTGLSFASYEMGNRLQGLRHGDERTWSKALISGAWAGFVFAFVVTPIDLLKTRMQMEGVGEHLKTTKISTLTRNIVKQNGLMGLFKGLTITMIRDVPGVAAQYGIFEVTKKFVNRTMGESGLSSFLAGAVGSVGGWIFAYPQDILKTRIQYSLAPLGIIETSRDIYQKSGFGGFWKGISPCLIRAVITGAARFIVYDKTQEFLARKEHLL